MTPDPSQIPGPMDQHRMLSRRLDGTAVFPEHPLQEPPAAPARKKVTTVGYQETAAEVAKLVGATGAHRFALIWTHPEYPLDRPEEPPPGVAVTWTAVACFYGGPKRVARELQIDRGQLELVEGRVVVAASCYGLDHGKSIATAAAELMRRLGVNVTFGGGTPARVVDNPRDALLEALSG